MQPGLLHRSGNWAARWLCCSGAPQGVAALSSGKLDGKAARVREPPCSEVGADVSGNRNGGGGFMARRPCRRRHICPGQLGPICRWKYGRPRSAVWAIARATARSNGLHGFGVHEWSPLYCLGNRVMERASQIRETEFCEGVRSRGQPRGCTWWRTGSTCGQPDVRGVRTTNS